jgi:outer membrane protein TolC
LGCLYPQAARAELLTFDSVLTAALKNSFDIKISQEDTRAGQAFVHEMKADHYPQLSVRFGNEYVHAFEEDGDVVSVGDAIIANDASGYKHSFIAGLSYNLFDFGVRRLTVENARRQVQISRLQERQVLWEVRKEILNRYYAALKVQKQIQTTETILARQNKIFRLSRQLRQAGTVGREQVGTAALSLAETLSQLDDLKVRYQNALDSLSYYTQQTYLAEQIHLADLVQVDELNAEIDLDFSPEMLVVEQQIENKKAELSMVKRAQLPKLTLYGSYRMFGSDADTFAHSLADLSSRDASVTLYLEWPIFDGFGSRAKKTRLKHEIASLRYQKQKKRAELQQELSGALNSYETHTSAQENRQKELNQIVQERDDAQLLAEQQITDQISFHSRMVDLARQRVEVELGQIDFAVSAMTLDFMHKAVQ